jgi:peptidoglycan hydrolase CwlO-like protein
MRQSWTDSRMDDLKDQVARIDAKFDCLDAKVDRLDAKVDNGFARLDGRIDRLDGRIDGLDGRIDRASETQAARIDALSETILTAAGRLFGACIAVVIAILGLIATQL